MSSAVGTCFFDLPLELRQSIWSCHRKMLFKDRCTDLEAKLAISQSRRHPGCRTSYRRNEPPCYDILLDIDIEGGGMYCFFRGTGRSRISSTSGWISVYRHDCEVYKKGKLTSKCFQYLTSFDGKWVTIRVGDFEYNGWPTDSVHVSL